MSKHTPGPWIHNPGKRHIIAKKPKPHNPNAEYYFDIAEVMRIGTLEVPGHGESGANARLIAAAPDMYEALVACRDMLLEYCMGACILTDEDGFCEDCEYMEAYEKARAAIERAEGE